jgi:phosphatidylglycerol---prolipoprotein diacylglyceryl transferase
MIPFYRPPNIHLGPLTIEPFGIFAAAGIYLAARLAARACKKQGVDLLPLLDYAPWGVAGGIVMGHFVHLFLYHPEELHEGPLRVLKVWDGLSSFGGLLGGVLAAIVYFGIKKIPFSRYADAFALGVAPGWGVARLGCFAVHDHPGIRSDSFIAVAFPGGGRFDLGLIDAIALFSLTVLLYLVARSPAFKGKLLGLLAVLYGIQRFFTDFLRASDTGYVDARYFGLTPAQYGCVLLVGYGIWKLVTKAPMEQPSASGGKVKMAAAK